MLPQNPLGLFSVSAQFFSQRIKEALTFSPVETGTVLQFPYLSPAGFFRWTSPACSQIQKNGWVFPHDLSRLLMPFLAASQSAPGSKSTLPCTLCSPAPPVACFMEPM